MVVVVAPAVELLARIGQTEEDLHVQAFVAQLAVETLNVAVPDRLARPDEVQMHSVLIGPQVPCLTSELRSVIDGDRLRRASNTVRKVFA